MAGLFLARPEGEEDEAVKTQNQNLRLMRDARRRLRWTQFDLAQRVGCSESQIAKIETGRATPERWLKETIAHELNIATWEVEASVSLASHRKQTHESNARSIEHKSAGESVGRDAEQTRTGGAVKNDG